MANKLVPILIGTAIAVCAATTVAQAQATRTWVSGTGDDANPCSRTAPCKTFAGAISKTADCGEIDALDPGGFGAVTITKGLKIDGGGGEAGQVASIIAGTGQAAIIINNSSSACPTNVLRNLDINGIQQGTIGVNIIAGGTVALENVDIENFQQLCLNAAVMIPAGVTVYGSNFEHCVGGIVAVANGGTGTQRLVATASNFSKSQSGPGLGVGPNSKVLLKDSTVNNNGGGGVLVAGTASFLDLQHCMISNNQGAGIHATLTGTVTMADTSVNYNNGTGVLADGGGSIVTWNNNWVTNNNPDGARTGTIPPQ